MKRLLAALLLGLASQAASADFRPFTAASKTAIEQAHAGQPFVLAFWSVDCAYCAEDIRRLGELVRKHPAVALVTVCVDDSDRAGEAAEFLDRLTLPPHERWQFAASDAERLRYRIDPQWYGELPRSYYYTARRQVRALSGRPDVDWLEQWGAGQ